MKVRGTWRSGDEGFDDIGEFGCGSSSVEFKGCPLAMPAAVKLTQDGRLACA